MKQAVKCGFCGRELKVRVDGNLPHHKATGPNAQTCEGSGTDGDPDPGDDWPATCKEV